MYAITNWNNKVLYIGMTHNLERRMFEHKNKLLAGFSATYNLNKLVYFKTSNDVISTISREKEIKKWRREKKNAMIETINPEWKDLSLSWK